MCDLEFGKTLCPHNGLCGGCLYQETPYADQLAAKEDEVRRLLAEREIRPRQFDGIEGCPPAYRYRYRNKMEYTFGDLTKGGPLSLGMHRVKSFMSIVTVDQCQLVPEDFNRILRFTLDHATERGYCHYNKKTHRGLLRHLILRRGVRTGELLVNLVTSREPGFDEAAFVDGLLSLPLDDRIVGILRTYNDDLADKVTCEALEVLWGRTYYEETVLGLRFRVSAFSFFQTNVAAAERLYAAALDLLPDVKDKTVFDLYCGTGTISQVLALRAKSVVGIELVEEAVEAASANAALNGLSNCRFLAGDVFEVLAQVPERPDVIVVDPPRAGMHLRAVERIAAYGVPQLVYISCNPKTLAVNLQQLAHYGYRAVYAKPYDNFPGTRHVECVALVEKAEG